MVYTDFVLCLVVMVAVMMVVNGDYADRKIYDGLKRSVTMLSQRHRRQFLAEFNQRRSNVNPSAANMRKMMWSVRLEALASQWAANCIYKYGIPAGASAEERYGQTIYIAKEDESVPEIMAHWCDDSAPYVTYQNDSIENDVLLEKVRCSYHHRCAIYFQVVWAESDEVGCSLRLCDKVRAIQNTGFDSSYLVVCYYGPSGKSYDGHQPYIVGQTPCSECPPSEFYCENRMCVPRRPCALSNRRPNDCSMKDTADCLCDESYYLSVFKKNFNLVPYSWNGNEQRNTQEASDDDYIIVYDYEKSPGKICTTSGCDEPVLTSDLTEQPQLRAAHSDGSDGESTSSDRTYIWIIVGVLLGTLFFASTIIVTIVAYRRVVSNRNNNSSIDGRILDSLLS